MKKINEDFLEIVIQKIFIYFLFVESLVFKFIWLYSNIDQHSI
jgi:hypothetical protein